MSNLHPHHLHARAALWALRCSWPVLRTAYLAARTVAAIQAAPIRSRTHGTIGRAGLYADPTAGALDDPDRPGRGSVESDHLRRVIGRLAEQTEAARWLTAGTGPDLLRLPPERARDVAGHLAAADRTVRRELAILPELRFAPGNPPCPSCGVRLLRTQSSAPHPTLWTVVCTAGCRCTGPRCPCGTGPVQPLGAVHIWTADDPAVIPPERELAAA